MNGSGGAHVVPSRTFQFPLRWVTRMMLPDDLGVGYLSDRQLEGEGMDGRNPAPVGKYH